MIGPKSYSMDNKEHDQAVCIQVFAQRLAILEIVVQTTKNMTRLCAFKFNTIIGYSRKYSKDNKEHDQAMHQSSTQ